jgi:hypothetical protein
MKLSERVKQLCQIAIARKLNLFVDDERVHDLVEDLTGLESRLDEAEQQRTQLLTILLLASGKLATALNKAVKPGELHEVVADLAQRLAEAERKVALVENMPPRYELQHISRLALKVIPKSWMVLKFDDSRDVWVGVKSANTPWEALEAAQRTSDTKLPGRE